jgi:hypothetical protein
LSFVRERRRSLAAFIVESQHLLAGLEPDSTFLFACEIVDDFVAARTHDFNNVQQAWAASRKRLNQVRSTKFHRFQQGLELGSDQGVGGSNPLSPTNLFMSVPET